MTSDSPSDKSRFSVRPWHLAALFSGLVLLFLVTTLFEYRYRKEEIGHLMREEALLLIDAMTEGAEQSLSGYRKSQSLFADGLLDRLRMIGRMSEERLVAPSQCSGLAAAAGLRSLMLADSQGRTETRFPSDGSDFSEKESGILAGLEPVMSGKRDWHWFIFRPPSSGGIPLIVAAIRRQSGGVVAGSMDATGLLEFRRTLGIGKLVRGIGADTTGIEYIIWQDSTAVLAATPNVWVSQSIRSDPFLSSSLRLGRASVRLYTFGGRQVYEVVKPFSYDGRSAGLFRIGLKTDHFDAAFNKLRSRMFMILGLVTIGAVAVVTLSITRRKEALVSDAWQRERNFSSAVLESMADAVVAIDTGFRVTLFNSAAETLFGLSGKSVRGLDVAAVLPAACLNPVREVLEGKCDTSHEEFECLIGNVNRYLSVHCSEIDGPMRQVEGVVCVLRDLSEQRAMQEIIGRREKLTAMGELASGVAHEIRNPLNAIGILAQRLDIEFSPESDEEEYRQLVRSIVSEVYRVNSIVTRFLKFAAPARLSLVTVVLDDFVSSYLPLLKGEVEMAGIRFSAMISSHASVALDEEQMRQVLLNIVHNAVQATRSGGLITVVASLLNGQAVIEITDTGCGISGEKLPRIFDLYFTTREDGTGMGLAIANRIVQAHGGTIVVASREHEGSTFRITLPVV